MHFLFHYGGYIFCGFGLALLVGVFYEAMGQLNEKICAHIHDTSLALDDIRKVIHEIKFKIKSLDSDLHAGQYPPDEDIKENIRKEIKHFEAIAKQTQFDGAPQTGAMSKSEYIQFFSETCEKMLAITKAKNSDYTGGADDPFANFRQISYLVQADNITEIGFITRMSDKLSRIGSFVTKGTLQVKDESIQDTLFDLAIYSILFAGFIKSEKQKMRAKGMAPELGAPYVTLDHKGKAEINA